MENQSLYDKLVSLPDELKAEAEDFIDFLAAKAEKAKQKSKPRFGSGKGMFVMKPDFDELLDDFTDYR
jgi:hypothetical protein